MGNVTQEGATRFLVVEMEEPRVVVIGVRFEIKQVIDLMWHRNGPLLVIVKDIESSKHSISVWGDLKGGNSKVICYPLKERMKRQGGTYLEVKPRPGAVGSAWQVGSLVDRGFY